MQDDGLLNESGFSKIFVCFAFVAFATLHLISFLSSSFSFFWTDLRVMICGENRETKAGPKGEAYGLRPGCGPPGRASEASSLSKKNYQIT
jgi:hypothetical protein